MSVAEDICIRMKRLGDEAQARHLMRFFKTGPGEYGDGDRFLGIRCPVTRSVVGEYRSLVDIDDVRTLLQSEYHEIRLAGFLLLIEIYKTYKKKKDEVSVRHVVDFYLSFIDRGNNWDLVDMVAPKILGDRLVSHPEESDILDQLCAMEGHLWHQRVSIVACWTIIRANRYDDVLRLAEKLLGHRHDLMHKATGWMLREVGKHGGRARLLAFLDAHVSDMPRTMLRYAIEQLEEPLRRHYMALPTKAGVARRRKV